MITSQWTHRSNTNPCNYLIKSFHSIILLFDQILIFLKSLIPIVSSMYFILSSNMDLSDYFPEMRFLLSLNGRNRFVVTVVFQLLFEIFILFPEFGEFVTGLSVSDLVLLLAYYSLKLGFVVLLHGLLCTLRVRLLHLFSFCYPSFVFFHFSRFIVVSEQTRHQIREKAISAVWLWLPIC